MTFTKEEQIQAVYDLKVGYTLGHADIAILKGLARMALAGLVVEPVAEVYQPPNIGICAALGVSIRMLKPLNDGDKLYTAPQPLTTSERAELENYRSAQQVVPGEKVIGTFDAEKNELALLDKNMTVEKFAHWHVHNSLEVIVRPIRTAMPQGDEPVSNRDRLPLDYLQGHKDGLEWAALLAEANHPQTGDWLYDDPLELAKAIRKGPDMPGSDGNSPVIPDGWVACSERMPDVGDVVLTAKDGVVNVGEMERSGANYRYFTSIVSGRELPATHWQPMPSAPQQEA